MTGKRSIDDVLPARAPPRPDSVLVAGPTAETLREVPERALVASAAAGDGVVAVTTREPASVVRDRVADLDPFGPDRVGVVDCTPDRTGKRSARDSLAWTVASPGDLTGCAIAVEECRSNLADRGVGRVHLLFDTLSTLLLSVESSSVLQFVHHLTTRGGPSRGANVFPVHTSVVDDRDLARLKHLFDGLVAVRRRGGVQQVRYRGFGATGREWVTLRPPAATPG